MQETGTFQYSHPENPVDTGNRTRTAITLQIEARVFATLRKYFPELGIGEPLKIQVEPGTTLGELREQLGLPANEVTIIMCNNVQVEPDQPIHDGDRIAFIPPIAGG